MKAIIAAAGRGTRMRELSKDRPKHLIEVGGRPFLIYVLENLRHAGIGEIIIVVGYRAEAMEAFAEKHRSDFPITLVNQFARFGEEKYGTAVPIEAVEGLTDDEPFIAIYGDNLYSPRDVRRLVESDSYNYITVLPHEHPEKYGVAQVSPDGFLERIVEKPQVFVSNLINTGLYKFTPEIFKAVKDVGRSPRGEYELTDAVAALAARRRVKVLALEDYWMDFGKPEDIPIVEQFLQSQK